MTKSASTTLSEASQNSRDQTAAAGSVRAAVRAYGRQVRQARREALVLEHLPLVHRIVSQVVSYLHPPLSREDTCRFVQQRLTEAGGQDLFEAPALEALYQASCGVPRRINQLAAWSLAKALEQGQGMVSAAAVAQVTQQAKAMGVNLDEAATPAQMPPPPPSLPSTAQTALPMKWSCDVFQHHWGPTG